MLVRSLLLTVALPAVAMAQAFEYAPGTSQYRITRVEKGTQEMMGQKQSGETSVSQTVTITLARPSKDTLAAAMVLDSISASTSMGQSPNLSHLLGVKVQTRMSPNGAAVYSVDAPSEEQVPLASQLSAAMRNFLPKMRGPLAKGSTWADTTTGVVKQYGIDVTRKVVSAYTVVGDTSVTGESAWKVVKTDSVTMNGNGIGQMGSMTVEGSSGSTSRLVVTSKGAYLGADAEEAGSVRIVISANGAEIGISSTTTTKVQRVK